MEESKPKKILDVEKTRHHELKIGRATFDFNDNVFNFCLLVWCSSKKKWRGGLVCAIQRDSDLAKKKKCRQNLEKKKKRKEKWVPVSYALVRNQQIVKKKCLRN